VRPALYTHPRPTFNVFKVFFDAIQRRRRRRRRWYDFKQFPLVAIGLGWENVVFICFIEPLSTHVGRQGSRLAFFQTFHRNRLFQSFPFYEDDLRS
jgi:hypothetical protein